MPPCAKSLEGRAAWRNVELTYVVVRVTPFARTLEDVLKLAPVTSRLSAPLPAAALKGESRLSCGTGLFTVNATAAEGLLPGFDTVTAGVPATTIALAGIFACNSVALE